MEIEITAKEKKIRYEDNPQCSGTADLREPAACRPPSQALLI